jgi:hypothetical protein
MGKRSAVVELFLGDMGSIQRELRPSTQREDQLTMETKLEQIAVKAVNQLPKSVVREIRTPRSVGAGGGRPPPATRWARRNPRPYRDHEAKRRLHHRWRPQKVRCRQPCLDLGLAALVVPNDHTLKQQPARRAPLGSIPWRPFPRRGGGRAE